MSNDKLDRRTFLRGAAGTALAVPTLECMLGLGGNEAAAAESSSDSPKRYFIAFAGMSIGPQDDKPDDGRASSKTFIPEQTGDDYDVSTGLDPLTETVQLPGGDEVPLKDYVSVVSNLLVPTPSDVGSGGIPPAGRPDKFHAKQLAPLFTANSYDPNADYYQRKFNGTSSDQIVAQEWDETRTMIYRAQYRYYSGGNPAGVGRRRTTMSTRMRNGEFEQILPTINPGQAFMDLFGKDSSATNPDRKSRRELLTSARKGSVLDLVHDSYKKLRDKVGSADRNRLDKHAHNVRELEKRIEDLSQQTACTQPAEPGRGWDPDDWEPWGDSIDKDGSRSNWAWNDETTRAELLGDIIYHGFKCGISNVATLCLSLQQSFMSAKAMCGLDPDIHSVGHKHGDAEDIQKVVAWHVRLWSRVLRKLAETPEHPNSDETMLDNTASVLLFEGGYGENFEKDESSSYRSWSTHSTQNMSVLVGGGAGGLKGNTHVRTDEEHPATCLMSAMEAVGVHRDQFGDLDWKIQPKLFG